MPPVETPALETPAAPVAEVLPVTVKLPEGSLESVAGEFWKDDASTEPVKPAVPAPKEEPAKPVTAEPPKPATTLAEKLAAKAKPAAAATAAEPAKPAEPAKVDHPEDKLALDQKSSPKARENFEALRTITRAERQRADALAKEAAELKAKLEAAAKAPAAVDTVEAEKLKAQNKAMSDRLLLIDTQNHPAFQQQYVAPRREALAAAAELLKAHGKEADFAALIEKPRGEIGKALATLLDGVPAFDQTEISANVQKAYQLAQAEKAALANAAQVSGDIRQHEVASHNQAFEHTWNKLVGSGITEILQPIEVPAGLNAEQSAAIEEYNREMKALPEMARKLATGAATKESIAEAAIKAASYELHVKHVLPRLGAEISAMQEIIKAQKKEIDGYRSRNPNREISASPAGKAHVDVPESIEDAAEAAFSGKR